MVFLDTKVYVEDGVLKTTLHVKPTDSHSYLAYDSCHPKHNITGIPYSQFLRVRRICTEWPEFAKHSINMMMHFSMRGYPLDLLTTSLEKVNAKSRSEVMLDNTPPPEEDNKKLFFITTHNPTAPDMKQIINTHWPILGRSNATRQLLDCQLIFGFRRPKNLRDELCPAALPTKKHASAAHGKVIGGTPCNRPDTYVHCPRLNLSGKITSHSNHRVYKIVSTATCQSNNLIYALTCDLCHIQYVGQTQNRIMDRYNGHLSTIRCKADTTVARHMAKHNIFENPPITISILQFINGKADTDYAKVLRNKWENIWIARLDTLIPHGLNIQD